LPFKIRKFIFIINRSTKDLEQPTDIFVLIGLHADYISFWQEGLLQKAIDDPTCQQDENVYQGATCATLAPLRNELGMQQCVSQASIVQEEVGIAVPSKET
jgi:hypothetical protein